MSLKPFDTTDFVPIEDQAVQPGGGIANDARSMKHYSAGSKHGAHMAPSAGATGGMNVYVAHDSNQKPGKKPVWLIVVVALVVVALLGVVAFGVTRCASEVASEEEQGGAVTVTIPAGYGSGDISQLLVQKGVVSSTKDFLQAVQQQGASSSLKAGTYTFEPGLSYEEVVKMLVEGGTVSGVTVVIPEGLTVEQTAQRVSDALGISFDEFMAQAKASYYVGDYTFLNGAYDDSLQGFLFPKTYTFDEGASADTVIRAMLNQFSTETAGLDWTSAAQGNVSLSTYQVIVMASLVERETAVDSERAVVASVMFNRLNADPQMPLQIDAAIAYALGKYDLLTYDDLQVDSPYNLYTNYGLCPGPICSPSLASITAVLNAAETDYYYYVASPALDGSHVFCSTLDEFEVAKAEYNAAAGIAG